MNYLEIKNYIRSDMDRSDFTDSQFDEWQELANWWLVRDLDIPQKYRRDSVTPTTNPFFLSIEEQDVIDEIFYIENDKQIPLVSAPRKRIRQFLSVTGTGPLYYTRVGVSIEAAPSPIGYTLYYTAKRVVSVLDGDTDINNFSLYAPAVLIAAIEVLAYRYLRDPEGEASARQLYEYELARTKEHEAFKAAGNATESAGAWEWHA